MSEPTAVIPTTATDAALQRWRRAHAEWEAHIKSYCPDCGCGGCPTDVRLWAAVEAAEAELPWRVGR